MQRKAPESLVIKVLRIETTTSESERATETNVVVRAEVRSVERTRTNLKPGDVITIRYRNFEYRRPVPGPGSIPTLRTGETYPSFLEGSERPRGFYPAAGAYTFERLTDEKKEN
jgi:hypothetical protein